jgi:TRAP-type C4-dicarboxylate transport system permease small subunit
MAHESANFVAAFADESAVAISTRATGRAAYALLSQVCHLALLLGAWLVVAVGLLVASDVLGRSVLGQSVTGTVELARNTVVLIVFCQVPASILEGKMLRVVALLSRFTPPAQRLVEGVSALVAMAVFGGLVAANMTPMLSALATGEVDGVGILQMPMGPVRVVLAALWTLSFLAALAVLIRTAADSGPVPVAASH